MNIKSKPQYQQEHVKYQHEHVEHEHQDERRENVLEGVDSSEGLSERRHECMGSEVA